MNKNFTLAVDTLGSETKVSDILKGLNQSLLRNINFNFLIFGCESEISKYMKKYPRLNQATKIINCSESITMSDKPSEIIKTKKKSRMHLAVNSVKEGLADSILSFGNTGALMSIAILYLKTLREIKRPSIASIWPNMKGESIVLDLGANTKLNSKYLVDNAILGTALAKILFKIDNPNIGILNVGSEDIKGNDELKSASDQLKILSNDSIINYYGYVEGNDISVGKTNVVVTDGFTGNIALKTAEGTAKLFQNHLNLAFKSSFLSILGYFFSSLAIKSVKERLDPRVHNCGIFMGLNSLVIKCHGQSEFRGVSYAADIIYLLLSNDVNKKIKEYITKIQDRLDK